MIWRGIAAHRKSAAQALRIMTFMHVRPPTRRSPLSAPRTLLVRRPMIFFYPLSATQRSQPKKDSLCCSACNDSVITSTSTAPAPDALGVSPGGADRFFNGDYDCYCYLPLCALCSRHLLAAKLRSSTIDRGAPRYFVRPAQAECAFLALPSNHRRPQVFRRCSAERGAQRRHAGPVRGAGPLAPPSQLNRNSPPMMFLRKSGSEPPVGVVRLTKSNTLPSFIP